MKRHESLYPLSHHHHHALVIALKLKQAGTEKSKLSPDDIKIEAQHFWRNGGQKHFREEEEILLPAYAQFVSIDDQPAIAKMLLEHVKIRSLMEVIRNASLEELNQLGTLLANHVREEERVIFPMIEEALPEEKIKELAGYLRVNN
ncbi:hypothetical protein CFK37_11015 [Virgibacillus phasianinus]|uniref:Hemerythrin-like domain-containing protein n=1 Tax=Virgibacillus phasianinus TaxID=2017483 RepID=A0A220U8D2_9BACI|nr:hypothetical protein CFK37_11015 [Virgibacillus phasianinus]